MSKGTLYTSEFKREAVKLAQTSEHSVATTAKELGVKPNTLYNWVNKAMKEKTITNKPIISTGPKHRYSELEQENRQLKKQLKRTELERDILKKAAAYFASQEL